MFSKVLAENPQDYAQNPERIEFQISVEQQECCTTYAQDIHVSIGNALYPRWYFIIL
jgi:hypothetical protein